MMKRVFRNLLLLLAAGAALPACSKKNLSYSSQNRQYIFSKEAFHESDSSGLSFINLYRDSLQKNMNTVLAHSRYYMTKELPEGVLGNYCADACLREVNRVCQEKGYPAPQLLLLNHGGLRASLPAGNITTGNVYEVMPFENELVLITISAYDLDSLVQYIASKGGAPVSGIRFNIRNKKGEDILIQGKNIRPDQEYHVATSDYMANGGDGFVIFKKYPERKSLSLKVRDALINDLKLHGMGKDTLSITKDGRITKIQ